VPLNPSNEVFITCAVTGSGDSIARSSEVPITPAQIASSALEAASAGAAIVHLHVREPDSGKSSRRTELYREVVDRIRQSDIDVVLNLTGGMGGDLAVGPPERPLEFDQSATDMAGVSDRIAHIAELRPEICTIDCGSMNLGSPDSVMINTPRLLLQMARQIQALGVRPEIEIFDTGHLYLAKWLASEGVLDDPIMVQFCMGVRWGIPDDLNSFMALVNNLPEKWTFSAFGIGRSQLLYTSLSIAAGGNIRVGLEDNLWLEKGVLATNKSLVERAVSIARAVNAKILTPQEVRQRLRLSTGVRRGG
jgi:uncharacterized protein (DUF849 family)